MKQPFYGQDDKVEKDDDPVTLLRGGPQGKKRQIYFRPENKSVPDGAACVAPAVLRGASRCSRAGVIWAEPESANIGLTRFVACYIKNTDRSFLCEKGVSMMSKGEQTRQKIISEARRLFELQGFQATSLNDLLVATDLKKGALYFHFSSKDEIGLAGLERARAELEIFLDQALTGTTPGACLENFFRSILDWHRQLNFAGGCIFGNIALEMGDTNERFASFVDQVFTDWIARIGETLSRAQASGEVRSGLPAEALARHVVAATEGGIMLSRLKKNEQPLQDCFDSLRSLLGMSISQTGRPQGPTSIKAGPCKQ